MNIEKIQHKLKIFILIVIAFTGIGFVCESLVYIGMRIERAKSDIKVKSFYTVNQETPSTVVNIKVKE